MKDLAVARYARVSSDQPAQAQTMAISKNNFRTLNKGDSLATWTGEKESWERSMPHWRRI